MNVPRKRRFWPLAGVLLVVLAIAFTAGAVLLQQQSRWIHERRAYLTEHPLALPMGVPARLASVNDTARAEDATADASTDTTAGNQFEDPTVTAAEVEPIDDVLFSGTLVPEPTAVRFPRFVLWLWGEAEVGEFDLRFTLDDAAGNEVDRVRELFPESSIRWSITAP